MKSMESLYNTEKGKKEILKLYNQKLEELNIDFEYLNLDTFFGKTTIIATGNISNPPILIFHGSNGCAPITLETYSNLSKNFRVYAIDVLAQPNKSAATRLSMKDDSYGQWVNEIINVLNIENVTMAGFSFGGLIILFQLNSVNYPDSSNPFESLGKAYLANGDNRKALTLNPKSKILKQIIKELEN